MNVILITADTLRADHLTPYGYEKNTSPYLEEFADKSIVYLNAISPSGATIRAISSIFTSKFPQTDDIIEFFTAIVNGEERRFPRLKEEETTLAEILKENGYYTKAITSVPFTSHYFGFSQGFDDYDDTIKERRADEVRRLAIDWLKRNNKTPFFLWIHFFEPHDVAYKYWCTSPKPYFNEFYEPLPEEKIEYHIYNIHLVKYNVSNEVINKLTASYDGRIRFLDENLKMLFQHLEKSGLMNNTIIIFTSDHGESLGEHYIFDHNNVYYGTIHVPLIIYHPRVKPERIERTVSTIDVFPTLLDMLKIEFETKRGMSLLDNVEEPRYSEFLNQKTVVFKEWKLMIIGKNEKLYNIKEDPEENFPIENKEVEKKLIKFLNSLKG
jgi:arylsulfatase